VYSRLTVVNAINTFGELSIKRTDGLNYLGASQPIPDSPTSGPIAAGEHDPFAFMWH
jgi:hypothetical protein